MASAEHLDDYWQLYASDSDDEWVVLMEMMALIKRLVQKSHLPDVKARLCTGKPFGVR